MSIDNRLTFERTVHNIVTFVIRRLRVGNSHCLKLSCLTKKKGSGKDNINYLNDLIDRAYP